MSLLIKIGTIIINTFFFPMRNKLIPVVNPYFRIRLTLGKYFLPSAGYGGVYPAKSCAEACRSDRQVMRGQVNMADEAKPCSPIHSAFEALVAQHAVGHCCGEELGPSCWPMLTTSIEVLVLFINLHTSQM